jgi:hypothetical protein
MAKLKYKEECDCKMQGYHMHGHMHKGAGYGLGFIGAAVYFIGQATTFWMGVLGFLKALVWPAFLIYGLLKFLGL